MDRDFVEGLFFWRVRGHKGCEWESLFRSTVSQGEDSDWWAFIASQAAQMVIGHWTRWHAARVFEVFKVFEAPAIGNYREWELSIVLQNRNSPLDVEE